jgi:hypothetical protein
LYSRKTHGRDRRAEEIDLVYHTARLPPARAKGAPGAACYDAGPDNVLPAFKTPGEHETAILFSGSQGTPKEGFEFFI